MQRKPGLFFAVAAFLGAGLFMGCHSGPAHTDGSAYRGIERERQRGDTALAVTGADIAARVERIDGQAAMIGTALDSLEEALGGADLAAPEKDALYRQVAMVRAGDEALRGEIRGLRETAGRLNEQLAEQREINTALSEEHDKREAAGAAVTAELAVAREKLAKADGQRNLAVAVAAALALAVIGYILFKVRRFLKIIPV